jgi:hypothetical protein
MASSFSSTASTNPAFSYAINLDHRGKFRASLLDHHGRSEWQAVDRRPIQNGIMSYKEGVRGRRAHLVAQALIPRGHDRVLLPSSPFFAI